MHRVALGQTAQRLRMLASEEAHRIRSSVGAQADRRRTSQLRLPPSSALLPQPALRKPSPPSLGDRPGQHGGPPEARRVARVDEEASTGDRRPTEGHLRPVVVALVDDRRRGGPDVSSLPNGCTQNPAWLSGLSWRRAEPDDISIRISPVREGSSSSSWDQREGPSTAQPPDTALVAQRTGRPSSAKAASTGSTVYREGMA